MSKSQKVKLKSALLFILALGLIVYSVAILPDEIWLKKGDQPAFNIGLPVATIKGYSKDAVLTQFSDEAQQYKSNYLLFGVVPVKNVNVTVTNEIKLIPSGLPFGVKFFTQGVMVVGMSNFETARGSINPAFDAGIRTRDIILAINGKNVNTVEEVSAIIENSGGETIEFSVLRRNSKFAVKILPEKSISEDKYRAGMWVRDSTAGIGTICYINPQDKSFAGLGHGICDIDTGELMPLMKGTVLGATINDIRKGKRGSPGELKGSFIENKVLGELKGNFEEGVIGKFTAGLPSDKEAIPVAFKQDIKEGPAKIICCVDGETPEEYDITIMRVYRTIENKTKNMIIQVTDPRLIEKTGGIVQGMSGSPIIQNGHLVGAVTHVLVNDPTRGFGIFIENMLKNNIYLNKAA